MLQPVPEYKKGDEPATLHKVMQAMIGEGLRNHYEAPQKLSHELFVLLMQLNEQERAQRKKAPRARRAAAAEGEDRVTGRRAGRGRQGRPPAEQRRSAP